MKTPSSELLEDTRLIIDKMRQALKQVEFSELEEKDTVNAVKTVAKEIEEQDSARGAQELSVGDIWAEQGI